MYETTFLKKVKKRLVNTNLSFVFIAYYIADLSSNTRIANYNSGSGFPKEKPSLFLSFLLYLSFLLFSQGGDVNTVRVIKLLLSGTGLREY